MNARRYLIGLIFFALAGQILAATKSDTTNEKCWEAQIFPSLLVGEAIKLDANGTEFLGLYALNTGRRVHGGLLKNASGKPASPPNLTPTSRQ